MKTRKPLVRSGRLKPISEKHAAKPRKARKPLARGRMKKKKPRPASETLRIYGKPERRAAVRAMPCVVCLILSPFFGEASAGHSENAHTETGGTGYKADACHIAPLCSSHHRRYDQWLTPCDEPAIRAAIKAAAAEVERLYPTQSAA